MATKPQTKTNKKGETLNLNASGKSYSKVKDPKVVSAYTTTGGEKVVNYSDGRKDRSGGKSEADLLLEKGQQMIDQTNAEGGKQFAGSSFDKPLQTTTADRKDSATNMEKFDQKQFDRAQYAQNKKAEKMAADEAKTGKTTEDPYAGLDDDEKSLREDADNRIADLTSKYEKIEDFADQSTRDLISATKQIYAARVQKAEASNKRLLAIKGITNIRGGRSRYMPDLAGDILAAEEQDGADRVDEIHGEMLKVIAEANQARATGKMKEFNDHFNNLQEIESELNKQIKDNYDRAVAQDKLILDREKEARQAQKEEYERQLDTSERSAPALAKKLAEFKTSAERTAFINAYAEKTGIDPEILMGDITGALNDQEKNDLEIRNIENQIYNRNRSEDRQQKKDEEEDDVNDVTRNVISGATTLDDITGESKQKVITDLRDLGYYSATPPAWYIDMKNEESSQTLTPEEVKKEWETYREGIIGGV